MTTCRHCSSAFESTKDDLAFYEKVSPVFGGKKELIPPPTLCPDCRQQRRLSWRNERKLYHRKCDLTGKQIISIYSPFHSLTVYEPQEWWSDRWDPLSYGRKYTSSHSFFSQFAELQKIVPRLALFVKGNENSDYTNHADHLKNCYLALNAGMCESVHYSNWIVRSRDCVDCSNSSDCERCYEVLQSTRCYGCTHAVNSDDCSDCSFIHDCKGCKHCLLSTGLRNREYCILNKTVAKDEYDRTMRSLQSFEELDRMMQFFFGRFLISQPQRASHFTNAENCSGENIFHSHNVHDSYHVYECRDCGHCYDSMGLTDCGDTYETAFDCELDYELHACNRSVQTSFSTSSYDNSGLLYCDLCQNSRDSFGCIGLKRARHCILNMQYTKEEYEALVPEIIERMRSDCEWGEFFPHSLSPFGYNETVASEYFPLTKEEALAGGWKWHEEDGPKDQYLGPSYEIPDAIADVPDEITKQILRCSVTGKPYKIIPQELKFYRQMNIPVPRKCPDQRHKERMALRNPRKLWDRTCAKCQRKIATSYSPERPEIVYCEECYLKSIY